MGKVQDFDDKIKATMDELQLCMEQNAHLNETLYVMELYWSVRKFWSRLSDEDKDYLEGVSVALEKKLEWKLP
jgi:hypothetical protein